MKLPNFADMQQSEEDKRDLCLFTLNHQGIFLLTGTPGSGKSYAAEAVYHQACNFHYEKTPREPSPLFRSQAEIYFDFLETESKKYLAQMLKDPSLLVLDELGANRKAPSEGFLDFLGMVIDYRWRNREEKGTLITTNLSAKEIGDLYGPGFLSRIASGIVKRWDHADRRFSKF